MLKIISETVLVLTAMVKKVRMTCNSDDTGRKAFTTTFIKRSQTIKNAKSIAVLN